MKDENAEKMRIAAAKLNEKKRLREKAKKKKSESKEKREIKSTGSASGSHTVKKTPSMARLATKLV